MAVLQKPLNITVIQVGTSGDVYRSLMGLKAIHHLYPHARIQMIVRPDTATLVKRVDWIDSVIETPIVSQQDAAAALLRTSKWLDGLINQTCELLVNWTVCPRFSDLGALIASVIPAFVKLGKMYESDATSGFTMRALDAWSIYQYAWIEKGISQDIHQTDLITTQVLTALQIHHGEPSPDVATQSVTSRSFFQESAIGLPDVWMNRNVRLRWMIVDSTTIDRDQCAAFEASIRLRHPDMGIMVIGKDLDSNLPDADLSVILSKSQWFVSGPGARCDLASLLNVRILYITNLNCDDHGPYGNGHLVMQSFSPDADTWYGAWSYMQSEWFHKGSLSIEQHFSNLSIAWQASSTRILRSRIRLPNEGGGVTYENIDTRLQMTFSEWMTRIRGQMARSWFCGWLPSVEKELDRVPLSQELIKRVRVLQESLTVLDRLSKQGKHLSAELFQRSSQFKSGYLMSVEDRTFVDDAGKQLLEIETLMARVMTVEHELGPLLKLYQGLMKNLRGQQLSDLAKETAHAFDLVMDGIELLGVYSRGIMTRARPKMVAAHTTDASPLEPPQKII